MNAYIINHLADLHARIADVRVWAPSARRDALLEEYEAQIEEYEAALECDTDVVVEQTERAADAVEVSAALETAITTAQATGSAIVMGAHTLVNELRRVVPGCVETRNGLEIASVQTDGGTFRLVRRAGSYRAVAHWRAL